MSPDVQQHMIFVWMMNFVLVFFVPTLIYTVVYHTWEPSSTLGNIVCWSLRILFSPLWILIRVILILAIINTLSIIYDKLKG